MKLLHWCTLGPEGPSSLAAIRFSKLVRVSCIRIFPKGAKPFEQCPDIVSETEPDSFFLDVYFNAQPIQPSANSKDKQRAANALVPTTIAYAGGQVDFTVDLGTEYGTRLMIVKGQFEALSLAIYGQIVSEVPQPVQDIASSVPLPVLPPETRMLPSSIDPANSIDPTFLARNLLSLLDDSPPLSLIIQLMFCLKPDNDDWDDPDFPHLFVDFDQDIFPIDTKTEEDGVQQEEINFDFEAALDAMSRPVSDGVSEDTLTKFAQVVANTIGPKTNNQAFNIAKLLKISASQRPSLALALCQVIEPSNVFDAQSFDEDTLLLLLDASANAHIAHFLHTDTFLANLTEFQSVAQPKTAKQVAERLATRLEAWDLFEDALSNTMTDTSAATAMLRDIGSGEQSLGIWLASMTGHPDLVSKLAENPTCANSIGTYPQLFLSNSVSSSAGEVSHDEFIALVRAFIGVASVLAIWAWSDSLGHDICRERALGVLRLWQTTDGYGEIVNYLLLLRQFTLRLKWITSNDNTPRKSGIFGEQILSDLLDEPVAALNGDLVQTILSLKQPLSYISENQRLSMRKIALVVEDGLPAAIEELIFPNAHPLSHRRLRTLRVSVALVERKLNEDTQKGDWNVLQTIWDEHSMPLVPRLADLLAEIAQDLNGHFLITSPFPAQQQNQLPSSLQVLSQLFRLAEDILRLLLHLVLVPSASSSSSGAPLSFAVASYTLRSLVVSVADIFACTDAADSTYTQGTPACISAQSSHQICLEFLQKASNSGPGGIIVEPAGGRSGAQIVMSVLLKHSVVSSGRDPAYHISQIFVLIDYILPEPSFGAGPEGEEERDKERERWVTDVLPNVLDEMQGLFRRLHVENKVYLLRRLVGLDTSGLVGIAEWLFTEEIKLFERCGKALLSLVDHAINQSRTSIQAEVLLYQIGLHARLVGHMLRAGSDMLEWCIETLKSVPEAFNSLTACLVDLSTSHASSLHLDVVAQMLLSRYEDFDDDDGKFGFTLVLFSLRTIRHRDRLDDPALWSRTLDVLKKLSPESIDSGVLRLNVGEAVATVVTASPDINLSPESSSAILSLLEWLTTQSPDKKLSILTGIKTDAVMSLYDTLSMALSLDQLETLEKLRTILTVDEDEPIISTSMSIPDTLQLSLQELQALLVPSSSMPSTPTKNTIPDVLSLVISPPAALLRSPSATGLTKTYLRNDFRDLRQVTVSRQNTSRLPSMHVDVGINGQST